MRHRSEVLSQVLQDAQAYAALNFATRIAYRGASKPRRLKMLSGILLPVAGQTEEIWPGTLLFGRCPRFRCNLCARPPPPCWPRCSHASQMHNPRQRLRPKPSILSTRFLAPRLFYMLPKPRPTQRVGPAPAVRATSACAHQGMSDAASVRRIACVLSAVVRGTPPTIPAAPSA
jgi:hypothetical protein